MAPTAETNEDSRIEEEDSFEVKNSCEIILEPDVIMVNVTLEECKSACAYSTDCKIISYAESEDEVSLCR
jgi:hypothetical protein